MADLWLKLRMLIVYRWHAREWWADVWKHEPGERMCCDGYMCGCYGADYASWWEHLLKERAAKHRPTDREG